MNIFTETEGLSGENLGSALLRYLIINSHEIRDAIILLISDVSPIGPIDYSSHFSCSTEYPTFDESLGKGRLDILIQLDDIVIGIENKFFAPFQENQPIKYYKSLEVVAESLRIINHTDIRVLLLVLCPESRKNESIKKVLGMKNTCVITWEDILRTLLSIKDIANPVSKIVMNEFIDYLNRHFSFIHDFNRKSSHLTKGFPEYGTPLQGELVGKLWSLLPNSGGRLSNGKTWTGYYFYTDPETNEKGWFGFVHKSEIQNDTNNQAELIIAATYKPELCQNFSEVTLKNKYFIDAPNNTNTWVVNFDATWDSVEKWREKLSPFWNVVKMV